MTDKSQPTKGPGDGVLSTLNIAIDGLNLAKEVASISPAKAVFGTVAILLTMIRVSSFSPAVRYCRLTYRQDTMVNKQDYIKLGLFCAGICKTLERGIGEKKLDDLSESVRGAINELTT